MAETATVNRMPRTRRATSSLQRSAAAKLIRSGTIRPLLTMNGLAKSYYRVLWLGTAERHGILRTLGQGPLGVPELAATLALPHQAHDALGAWLDLGAFVGLVRQRGERYALRGPAKPLAKASNDAVAAFYRELTELHHPLITEAIDRLRDGRPLELGDADSELIARSSRISDPYLAAALEQVVPGEGGVRLLEVGCGSGAHIRTAAALNPRLTAVGLELQSGAADLARDNIAAWGLADRVTVEVGDVRDRVGQGEFDLVTLHQNIYYFPVRERGALVRHLGEFLTPGGRLLVTTICRNGGHAAAGLDLWCAMTRGADRLPDPKELTETLRTAGFTDVAALQLTPDAMFYGFVGTWTG